MKSKPLFLHDNMEKYFFNRKEDINKIKYQINSLKYNLPQQILLTGYRGVGKTYLLKKIVKETEPDIVCTYVDLSKLYALKKENFTIEFILIELLKNMNESITNKKYNTKFKKEITQLVHNLKINKFNFQEATKIFDIPIPKVETNYRKLSQFVMEFPQKVVDTIDEINGFAIIIDEFQMLRKIDHLEKFFWLIRSFNQTQHNVSYIFTGSISRTSELIQEVNGEDGAFGGRMIQINIKPFSKEETKEYFNERMPEIKFTDDGFERFYKCTRGIPLYINSFYNVMDSNEEYDSSLIKKTFYTNMDQILIMWLRIWSSLSTKEKDILKLLIYDDSLQWTELLEKSDVSRGTFNKYIRNLNDKGLIEHKNEKYYIEDTMLKTWLKHEKKVYGMYPL